MRDFYCLAQLSVFLFGVPHLPQNHHICSTSLYISHWATQDNEKEDSKWYRSKGKSIRYLSAHCGQISRIAKPISKTRIVISFLTPLSNQMRVQIIQFKVVNSAEDRNKDLSEIAITLPSVFPVYGRFYANGPFSRGGKNLSYNSLWYSRWQIDLGVKLLSLAHQNDCWPHQPRKSKLFSLLVLWRGEEEIFHSISLREDFII